MAETKRGTGRPAKAGRAGTKTGRKVRIRPPEVAPAGVPVELDAEQRAIVEHREGPLLVLAAPGAGKTWTLVESIINRIDSGVAPEQILALTFSRAAAAELRSRIVLRLGGGVAPHAATFHSYCYSLVQRHSEQGAGDLGLRPLSADEQQQWVRQMLEETLGDNPHGWPEELLPALATAGGAAELAGVLSHVRSLGHDPDSLRELAAATTPPRADWAALASFLDYYLDVLPDEVLDYSQLIGRAQELLRQADVLQEERSRLSVVFVDEYQDSDPQQIALLAQLVGNKISLVAVADPDQSIYRFRGADSRACAHFADDFKSAGPASYATLSTVRRFGPEILEPAGRVLLGVANAELPSEVVRKHRHPTASGGPSRTRLRVYESPGAEAEHIADLLRRTRLIDRPDLRYSDMAVLTRTAAQLPAIQRALTRAGVPSYVVADDVVLREQPAAATLALALRCAVEPGALTADTAARLLASGLVGFGPTERRDWARLVRRADAASEASDGIAATSSRELTARVLKKPSDFASLLTEHAKGHEKGVQARVLAFAELLGKVRVAAAERAHVAELLWMIWDGLAWGSPARKWGERLRDEALAGGSAGARADQDLDAVMALFALAERDRERYRGVRSVTAFLEAFEKQDVPTGTIAAQAPRPDAVQLLTAHGAKGLEWPVVVVAGVQEGTWPNVRMRSTLFDEQDLPARAEPGRGGPGVGDGSAAWGLTPAEALAEERRLFYVACTRARDELIVTAADGSTGGGERASRLLVSLLPDVPDVPEGEGVAALGGRKQDPDARAVDRWPVEAFEVDSAPKLRVVGRVHQPLDAAGLVARLRQLAADPNTSPAAREAALARLAGLVGVLPAADPEHWWGVRELTRSDHAVSDAPVQLSATALEVLSSCPLKWFLSRRLKAEGPSGNGQVFGSVAHALAEAITNGQLSVESVEAELDRIWPHVGYEARYHAHRERGEASRILANFVEWHERRIAPAGHVENVETERLLQREYVADDGLAIKLTGSIDRVEWSSDGDSRVAHVVDLKTTKTETTGPQAKVNVQLAFYQWLLAAEGEGAADPADVAGAMLLLLRGAGTNRDVPAERPQPALGSDGVPDVDELLREAAEIISEERFEARPSPEACRYCPFTAICPAQQQAEGVLA